MKKHSKLWLGVALLIALAALTGWYMSRHLVAVLQPAGPVGHKERNLLLFCLAISVPIVVVVFGLLGTFAWKYREGNAKAKYTPELDGSKLAETIWWLVPTFLIIIISIVTWQSSYALDPFKPLASSKPALHIQVVALDWKWLFIYPNEQVASVNEAAIPVGTPVDFEITSDAVMTSFWAPQLGGQMYAMPGMSTQLNLQASKQGDYRGVAANISGKGFAGMKFILKAMPDNQYDAWLNHASSVSSSLSTKNYHSLAQPSENNRPAYYASVDADLYDTILLKYMMPVRGTTTNNTNEMDMSGRMMMDGMSM